MAEQGKKLGNLLAALVVLALVGVVSIDFGTGSVGQLTATHASLVKLQGAVGCDVCHGREGVTMAQACAECHTDIQAQIDGATGMHGRLQREAAQDCGLCHKEHRGAEFQSVGDRAFQLAGSKAGLAEFRHQGLEFELDGKHDELACKECHEHAEVTQLVEGDKRFLGLRQSCVECHEDPHHGKLRDCAACHGQELAFDTVARFEHDERFPLRGPHARHGCKDCHLPDSPSSIENLGGPADRRGSELEVRECQACHQSPHAETFLAGVRRRSGVAAAALCSRCHESSHTSFYQTSPESARRLHSASGFELSGPHADLGCEECHQGIGERPAGSPTVEFRRALHRQRFPNRVARRCVSCHEDPHADQFESGPFAGQDCLQCHGEDSFKPALFGLEQHAKTGFELRGAHQAVGCWECHKLRPGAAATLVYAEGRVFGGTPKRCAECHVDVHDGAFDGAGRPAIVAGKRGCARCHSEQSFQLGADAKPLAGEGVRFEHGKWTGFVLSGGHRGVSCRACHQAAKPTHGGLRRFARARSRTCAGCHQDPHAGQFRQRGQTNCASCHSVAGQFELTTFEHNRQSRFKLDEYHKSLACAKCHKQYALRGGATLVRYKPLGVRCVDCHGWKSLGDYRRKSRAPGGRR